MACQGREACSGVLATVCAVYWRRMGGARGGGSGGGGAAHERRMVGPRRVLATVSWDVRVLRWGRGAGSGVMAGFLVGSWFFTCVVVSATYFTASH